MRNNFRKTAKIPLLNFDCRLFIKQKRTHHVRPQKLTAEKHICPAPFFVPEGKRLGSGYPLGKACALVALPCPFVYAEHIELYRVRFQYIYAVFRSKLYHFPAIAHSALCRINDNECQHSFIGL